MFHLHNPAQRYQPARFALACSAVFFANVAAGQAGPVVSNVLSSQRPDNSRLVDIQYDLAADGPCTVWFVVSNNGGTSWTVPAMNYTGAAGSSISPGAGKQIVWDAGADVPGMAGSFKVRVYADDGQINDMVLVPGGMFAYQNNFSSQIFIAPFRIDKYEVTNQRYCEYLNSADQNGTDPPQNHWHVNMEITQTGTPPNAVYSVNVGRQNYPIRWVSAFGAEAYAAWISQRDNLSYRLPTEQEWEKAAAWDNVQNIHWNFGFQSNSIDCTRCNYYNGTTHCVGNTSEVGGYNGTGGTLDSRSFFGCYDMSGNVWEWTSSTTGSYRVTRGGAWNFGVASCNTTYRDYALAPTTRNNSIGFRLVLDSN